MQIDQTILTLIKTFILSSVLFVWVIRYQNIVEEFKQYSYPNWLRDVVGILKITFVISIMSSDPHMIQIGSASISILMAAALLTHLRVKNPIFKMIPSFSLMSLNLIIFFQTNS